MNANSIPVVVVVYNTPELASGLLSSFRRYYSNEIFLLDGSDEQLSVKVKDVSGDYERVNYIGFGYNIHHGPGMAWAIKNLNLSGPVLFLDSDIEIVRGGFIEDLLGELEPALYGVGAVAHINRDGFDVSPSESAIPYLHPPCMLCNAEVMRQWPLPNKHGAPMRDAMVALHDAKSSRLLKNIEWVFNDLTDGTEKRYLIHLSQGTVKKTGSYHLDEWQAEVERSKVQRPDYGIGDNLYNHDVLRMIPANLGKIVEVGCNCGALARAYKGQNKDATYIGIELDSQAAEAAKTACDQVVNVDIEDLGIEFFKKYSDADCWIFADVLEHMKDPWKVLGHIRAASSKDVSIVASIPNAQHWSVIAKLAIGDFRYEDGWLLDRTHLRWFTRATIFELFSSSGYRVVEGMPRIFDANIPPAIAGAIRSIAQAVGASPELAVSDALALQYVVRAVRS